ncbi:MAG: PTS transporter subunit EIIA, partial [Gammaproteobacteria bacterium]|nr:PTS transporter subunit EIIA [Gammaproteobacteria bacterium]
MCLFEGVCTGAADGYARLTGRPAVTLLHLGPGLGNGIAIPHCRVPKCEKTIGCLVKLEQGIDFDAIDGKPVDLLFYLLVPENTIEGHLEVLRNLAERFNDQ